MMRRRITHAAILVSLAYGFLPGGAFAQSQITGVVTDPSGGVLPGVTVEAASPALIEKVRTAATDAQGRYAIVALRPGTWNQVDVNVQRMFRVGKLQVQPGVDLYNLLNSNVVITQNQNFGSALGRPDRVLQGRLVRLTAQIDF